MFQYHNNILCIQASALYNKVMWDEIVELKKQSKQYLQSGNEEQFMFCMTNLKYKQQHYKCSVETFLTKYTYKNRCSAGKLKKLTKGGNGRTALVAYSSLSHATRDKIEQHLGYNPTDKEKPKSFVDNIVMDNKGKAFFESYRKSNDAKLSAKQIAQYTCRTNIFNAITAKLAEVESHRGAFGKSINILWKTMAEVIATKDIATHKLPKHYRRLRETYNKYITNGYIGVLHKGLENDNSQKIKGACADWLLAMYCLPIKIKTPLLMQKYAEVMEEKDFPTLTEQAVHDWLHNTAEIKRIWVFKRHGKEEYDRQFKHTLKRGKSNWFPNSYWAIDGSKIDWVHYYDNKLKMAAKLKINPVFDIYSEKIIGWSFSETENHTDHFNTIKMAVKNTGRKPYLFTYDNQSGHKSSKMQELYSKLVATNGGVHYPNKAYAHNSPVEGLFNRLQQQVLNQLWFSDKQSPMVRTADNKPNIEFLMAHKHLLKTKEELIHAWEVCVKIWNDAKHPKIKDKTRNEVFTEDAPVYEEVSFLEQVEMFWIYNNRQSKYRKEGLHLTVANREYEYEVLDANDKIDIDFRTKYVGAKFIVKYDPDHLNDFVALYTKNKDSSLTFVANAQPKREHESIPVLMQEGDKEQWAEDYEVRNIELEQTKKKYKELVDRVGIDVNTMIEEQELGLKFGGHLPKEERAAIESEQIIVDANDRL